MLAPILAFTADEAWEFVTGRKQDSVHVANWKLSAFAVSETETANWKNFFLLREKALPELEAARKDKLIGKSLEAKATLRVGEEFAAALKAQEDLRELLNVSKLFIELLPEPGKTHCSVTRADGQKCERCWRWEPDIGVSSEHPTICGRCVEAVKQYQADGKGAKQS